MKKSHVVSPALMALVATGASADPKILNDLQMDRITAGTTGEHESPSTAASGGTIATSESQATLSDEASVSLGENVQVNAQALSLIGAADGLVASGVNLWDGASQDSNVEAEIRVLQSNELSQSTSARSASVRNYARSAGHVRDVSTSGDSTAPVQNIDFGLQLDIDGIGTLEAGAEVPAAVIPTAKIPGAYGNVVGFAGDLDIDFDGGEFEGGFDLDSSVSYATHLTAETETTILWGLVTVGQSDLNSRTSFKGAFNPYLTFSRELPDLSISGEGAVCYANGGICESSVLDRDIATLEVGLANAENVVIDRSQLEASERFDVTLSGEAQASARAVNLVNAAGGLVASGANIATVSDTGSPAEPDDPIIGSALDTDVIDLAQDNAIGQVRDAWQSPAPGYGEDRERSGDIGGTIVANESSADLIDSRAVTASSGAQSGARAVSLVNAADALVGTGVNVWDGRLLDGNIGSRADIAQGNELTQGQNLTAARLMGYERGAESSHEVTTSTSSAAKPKFLGTELSLQIFDPSAQNPRENPLATLTGNLDIPASIIPSSKIPGFGGTSAAFAGNVDMEIDGGSASLGFGIEESGLHFLTNNTARASGKVEGRFRNSTDVTIDGSLTLEVELPDLDVSVDGAACFAQKGSCAAGVTDRTRGALELEGAAAEYIVIDRSALDVGATQAVALDGAQSGARAVSLVNSAGGATANGINIASWRGEDLSLEMPLLNLAQTNDVAQTDGSSGHGPAIGGAIIAGESMANVNGLASVALTGGAQSGATALNIVNSADAMVANGLNLSAIDVAAAVMDSSVNVGQANVLEQDTSAITVVLGGYARGEGSLRDVRTSATTRAETSVDDGFLPVGTPGQITGEVDLQIGDLVSYQRSGRIPTSIIPTSKIPGGKPGALSVAGNGEFVFDGGEIALNSITENHFDSSTFARGDIDIDFLFGLVQSGASARYSEHIEADLETELVIDAELPDLAIDVEGAACITRGADCQSSLTEREIGALTIAGAAGENVVVDGSTLAVSEESSVALTDSSQADARALLITNAAGGTVANGLNVARITGQSLETQPNLAQSNLVLQGEADQVIDGGTIVANESTATLTSAARVSLEQSAQSGAQALAMTNAADALVGNGVNVWNSDINNADIDHAVNMQQTNQILQQAPASVARLGGYERDGQWSSRTSTSADSRVTQQYIREAVRTDLPGLGSLYQGLSVPAAAIPTSKIPGATGIVAGFAGEVDFLFDAGSIDVLLGIDTHLGYSNNVNTQIQAGDFLNFGTIKGQLDFGIDEFSIDIDPTFYFHADLPTLAVHAEGALCWANGGECSAGILEQDGGEISIDAASAEHLAVDHAALNATETYSVALDSGAQANARAMTIVNAANALVGNGVNVSTFRGETLSSPTVNLIQRNVIVQGR